MMISVRVLCGIITCRRNNQKSRKISAFTVNGLLNGTFKPETYGQQNHHILELIMNVAFIVSPIIEGHTFLH